jgi:hypothetical protein
VLLCFALQSDEPDKPKPRPAVSCGDNKEKHDCLDGAEEGDCAWCEGDFMPASCVGVKAAEWIPEQVGPSTIYLIGSIVGV